MSNSDALVALHRALQEGTSGDALRRLFTPDATVREHPNLVRPAGGSDDLDGMVAGSIAGAALLERQRYAVHDIVEAGDLVIARLTWTATIARDAGWFRAGDELEAHIAQFARVRDGRIASIETFDCYEPLPAH